MVLPGRFSPSLLLRIVFLASLVALACFASSRLNAIQKDPRTSPFQADVGSGACSGVGISPLDPLHLTLSRVQSPSCRRPVQRDLAFSLQAEIRQATRSSCSTLLPARTLPHDRKASSRDPSRISWLMSRTEWPIGSGYLRNRKCGQRRSSCCVAGSGGEAKLNRMRAFGISSPS